MNKTKISIRNIYYYIQGNVRYFCYYNKYFTFLIPKHILEQVRFRINNMDNQCYIQGSCKMCGCSTTALQMCNKACDKPCYPKMMNRSEWKKYKTYNGK